ncbi:MAG: helix-turn-helix transcriptional regulator [Verrucomicrobiae bacterium]|nr:helix-turn-helix transcriptional regulator [Verrucomicrobiae bacterium]
MTPLPRIPPVDIETYVPISITVVRRSSGWPGLFLQERRGASGSVNYPGGLQQHLLYWFLKPLRQEVITPAGTRTVHYAAGESRFTPAGSPVAFQWTGEVHLIMVGFQPWFFERVATDLGVPADLPVASNNAKLASRHPAAGLVRSLMAELEDGAGAGLVAEGIGKAIVVRLLREFRKLPNVRPSGAAPPAAVLRAVALMRRRLAEPLTLSEIAAAAGLSPFHFARQFKAATGHPPHEYLVRLRVDRAQELLRRHGGRWTTAAIAQECGFSDQSHLARHFKRVLGVTPGEFLGS